MEHKKELLIVLLVLILLGNVQLTIAQIPNPTQTNTYKQLQNASNELNNINSGQTSSSYLAKQWTEVLENSKFFSWIYQLNPFWQFLFGMPFSLSWAFVAAIIIWIGVIIVYYNAGKAIFGGQLYSFAIAILVGSITSNLMTPAIIKSVSNVIETAWQNALFIFGLIFLIILARAIEKEITMIIKKNIEKRKMEKLEKTVEGAFKDISEGAGAMMKGYGEGEQGEEKDK